MLNLISDWQNKNLKCFFCDTNISVKYEVYSKVIKKRICVCSKCVLIFSSIREEEN